MALFTPDFVLNKMLTGNQRYTESKPRRPNQSAARRAELAHSQNPFAVLLGCSDSRALPELIFDQGIGDLFVVRVAGHLLDAAVMGSIEYAVKHLEVSLVMVLGHERCGAVKAAIQGGNESGQIARIIEGLKAAVDQAREQPGDLLDNAVRANIALTVNHLKTASPLLAAQTKKGELGIVGARYDLDTGLVEVLSEIGFRK